MKKNNEKKQQLKNNSKVNTINQYNIFPVVLQFIFTILVIVFGILYFINGDFNKWFLLSLGLALIIMAYNNHMVYKRANFTILYLVVGVIILIISILNFLGVMF